MVRERRGHSEGIERGREMDTVKGERETRKTEVREGGERRGNSEGEKARDTDTQRRDGERVEETQ